MKVKICALTREADVELALELGADAVGFVVEPTSRRALDVSRAVELAHFVARRATTVVVFGHAFDFPEIEVFDRRQFRWQSGTEPLTAQWLPALTLDLVPRLPPAQEFVLEPHVPGEFGGTGQLANWSEARKLVDAGHGRMNLAGGLNPDNVAEAVRTVTPWGVDVASGTEASDGIKDPVKMRDFFAALRS